MIEVHLINDTKIVLNPDLIETVEATPDTVISLSTGKKVIVREPVELLIERIIEYRRKVYSPFWTADREKAA